MAIDTINVVGAVLDPTGAAVKGGKLEILLIPPGGTATDGSDEVVVSRKTEAIINPADGTVDFELLPNDKHNGVDGSAYIVTYRPAGGDVWVEFWVFDSAVDADPIDIGDVTRTVQLGPGPSVLSRLNLGPLVVAALPTPDKGLLGVTVILDTGSGETGSYTLHRSAAGVLVWVYSGGSPGPSRSYTSEPDVSSFDIGDEVFIDAGSGETKTIAKHRDADDVEGWVTVSAGGE